jgi:hypothetical protein
LFVVGSITGVLVIPVLAETRPHDGSWSDGTAVPAGIFQTTAPLAASSA